MKILKRKSKSSSRQFKVGNSECKKRKKILKTIKLVCDYRANNTYKKIMNI